MPASGGSQIVVRAAHPGDLDDVLKLYAFLHPADPVMSPTGDVVKVWQRIFQNPDLHCIVGLYGSKIVSTCHLAIIPNLTRGLRSYGLIENVVTHPHYRKRGLGKSVLRYALDIAWSDDCYKVMLLTGRSDEDTLHFYETAGFVRGVKTGFVAKPGVKE